MLSSKSTIQPGKDHCVSAVGLRRSVRVVARARQTGFTLFEVILGLIVVSILTAIVSTAQGPALTFFGKTESDSRLKDLRLAIENAYRENVNVVENVADAATAGRVFKTPSGTITELRPGANGLCAERLDAFRAIGPNLSTAGTLIIRDGFAHPFCIYITPRQAEVYEGADITYRTVAIVSGGVDGVVEPTTALSDDGVLTLAGDDRGITVPGRKVARDLIDRANATLDRVASAYSTFFTTRYLASVSRDVGVYYFSQSPAGISDGYDENSPMPSTSGAPADPAGGGSSQDMVTIDAHTVLGLTPRDVLDPYGRNVRIDNASALVRSPAAADAQFQVAPFTARLAIITPGNRVLSRTVVGSY